MLRIVEDEAAIRRGQRQFVRSFKPFADERISVKIGHPGASFPARVSWSERLGIWFFSRKMSADRYWNVFGIGRPEEGADTSIACEINLPLRGIDRKTGGALARDGAGRVFVVHRGKIGGGRKGIGKTLFDSHYRGVWVEVEDGGEERTVALIGVLGSPHAARQITQFVRKVDRIKTLAATSRRPQMEIAFADHVFREELIGEKYCARERDLEAECDHDLVVRDLSDALRRDGYPVANDGRCDLFIPRGGENAGPAAVVFDVRTNPSPASLQAGMMRLLLASLGLTGNPHLVLIVPPGTEAISGEKLVGLNIARLPYAWNGQQAVFPDLGAMLGRFLRG